MDSDAFLPLRPEEITTAEVPRRMIQLAEIIDDLATTAVSEGLCSRKDRNGKALTTGNGPTYYGRYLRLGQDTVLVALEHRFWARTAATPFWLRVDPRYAPNLMTRVRSTGAANSRDLRMIEDGSSIWIPLRIPTGVEKTHVVEALLLQLRGISALVPAPAQSGLAVS